MTRRKDPAEIRVPVPAEDLPAFAPVPVKFRHFRLSGTSPSPLEGGAAGVAEPQRLGRGGLPSSSDAIGPQRLGASYIVPNLTRAEKDDMNAAMIEHFDPVDMTLPEIEAMQEMLSGLA